MVTATQEIRNMRLISHHDLDGFVIPGAGGPGLISGSSYSQDGTSFVGGTHDEGEMAYDHEPASPANPNVIEENVAGLALTPDAVVGLPEGVLKRFAASGFMGGQYVTDPNDLREPLSGVTYVDLPSDDPWWNVAGDTILSNGTGVLVVHNSSMNAVVKNLNKGIFKGLIVADDIVHIHNTIIGAVVLLVGLALYAKAPKTR